MATAAAPARLASSPVVWGAFVEYAAGHWVRAEKVRDVAEYRDRAVLSMGPAEQHDSLTCDHPVAMMVVALNHALANERDAGRVG